MENKKINVTLIGDGATGKTCLILAYLDPVRLERERYRYPPTVLERYFVEFPISSTEVVDVEIIDTGGQEKLINITRLCYSETDVFILCYSSVEQKNFSNLENIWVRDIRNSNLAKDYIFILCGTKIDLVQNYSTHMKDHVTEKEIKKLAKKVRAKGKINCSALKGTNVKEVFEMSIKAAYENKYIKKKSEENKLVY
eukprot:snap_masked-scaffold_28-processed-gene-2.12-mRNA-1 protein AED:0.02 eAED:0.09 QI:0/0/0/0.5/1/1/2/0/196